MSGIAGSFVGLNGNRNAVYPYIYLGRKWAYGYHNRIVAKHMHFLSPCKPAFAPFPLPFPASYESCVPIQPGGNAVGKTFLYLVAIRGFKKLLYRLIHTTLPALLFIILHWPFLHVKILLAVADSLEQA